MPGLPAALAHLLLPLARQLADSTVTEVLANADDDWWIEQSGALQRLPLVCAPGTVQTLVRLLASHAGHAGLETHGWIEGAWEGWRMTGVQAPVCAPPACLALRRHGAVPKPLAHWALAAGTAPVAADSSPPVAGPCAAQIGGLAAAVAQRRNILVAGSTGAGKTTLLAGLIHQVAAGERVVSLEDTPELPVCSAHHLRLCTTPANDLRSLVRLALRLRPDRIVVGEVRGGEAFDLLQAFATGHAGGLATVHAADALGALQRLEHLVLAAGTGWPPEAIRAHVARNIHLVVHVGRHAGARAIDQVVVVEGIDRDSYQLREHFPGPAPERASRSMPLAGHGA